MAEPLIRLKNINKTYNPDSDFPTKVLFDINLDFNRGSFSSIIGQSGSGKSTLLNILGTLDRPTSGTISINGKDTASMSKNELSSLRNKTIGFIFQFHYLLPEFTALENVLMPHQISKEQTDAEAYKHAEELLDFVGLTKFKDNPANEMSGGQQQRVAIARSLMNNPDIILADEPTGNLDSDTTETIYKLLRDVNKTYDTTFIVITHDRKIAEKTDRVIELKDGRVDSDFTK